MRIQRLLAASGLASRRAAEQWIREGRVQVNGRIARLGERADPARDIVCVDGTRIAAEPLVYWLLHKPLGVVTTLRDPQNRLTVRSLLPPELGRIFPVGRLDRETSGLLLFTNDGPLAHALLHPSRGIEREYVVRVRGVPRASALRRLARGVVLEDGRTAPARVEQGRVQAGEATLRLTLIEGRKRQIRRALATLGHPVISLCRVRFGPLRLGRLPVGDARALAARERNALLEIAGLEGSRARTSPPKHAPARRKTKISKKTRN